MKPLAFPVDRSTCQASFGWHFVREIVLIEKSPPRAVSRTHLALGADPYIERDLGHYSSGLLLEIGKQLGKATVQAAWPMPGPVRYMLRDLQITFSAYTLLNASCEVTCDCEITILATKNGALTTGAALIRVRQGGVTTTEIRFTTTVLTPERERALEARTHAARSRPKTARRSPE
jgi:hypothetical protein